MADDPTSANAPEDENKEVDEANQSPEENKPLSPEMEAVNANKPSQTDPESSSGGSSEEEKKEEQPSETEGDSSLPEGHEKVPVKVEVVEPKEEAAASAGSESAKKEAEKPAEEASDADKPQPPLGEKKEGAAPTKIGKEKNKRKSNANFLITLGLIFVGLFVLFIVLMVLVIGRGDPDSAILTNLGLDAAGIKSFLLTIINLSFGFLALLFFVLLVIGIFRLLFAKKTDKEAKKRGVKMTIFSFFPLAFVMVVWLMLFNFIGQLEIAAERVQAEILILEPTDLSNLSAPLEVTFSSENVIISLQNSDFRILGVRWDFDGDGEFETEPTDFAVSYLYNRSGSINVGLEVDVEGEEAPRQYFYPLEIKEALFSAIPDTGTAPLDVAFDASALIPSGRRIQSLDWDFDGDSIYELTGQDNLRPSYTFEKIGIYTVHLRMVDEANLVENYYRDIEIVPGDRPPLLAQIDPTPGLSGPIPLQIRFDGGNSSSEKSSIVNYEWDFGDGSQLQQGRSVSHIYEQPGVYSVTLTVKDAIGGEATDTVQVEAKSISSVPEARIQTTPAAGEAGLSGDLPLKVSFDASGSLDEDDDIVDYEWDFGIDSATQGGQKVEFTYEQAGNYTVTLTVRDSDGQEGEATLQVEVLEPGVRADISAEPAEGSAPLIVQFDGSGSSTFEGNIVSYEWHFGDESPPSITGAQISHKYDQVGTYEVRLKVVTNQNESAETTTQIFVREVPLTACFEPSRTSGTAPVAVTFDAKCSTGSVASYAWDFGDGDTSDLRKPAHTFEEPGTYNVTLEVADDKNNVDTFNLVIVAESQ